MKLTGKCKEAFEKWYVYHYDNRTGLIDRIEMGVMSQIVLQSFYGLHPSMQYGVFVDFFDSVGIFIELRKGFDIDWYYYQIETKSDFNKHNYLEIESRSKARTAAITKANEIYNKK